MSRKFTKYQAQNLHKIVENTLLKGELIKKPLWVDVMKKYPPMGTPIRLAHRDPTRFNDSTDGQVDFQLSERYCKQFKNKGWTYTKKYGSKGRWNDMVREAGKIMPFPREIKFQQDAQNIKDLSTKPLLQLKPVSLKDTFSHGDN